MVLIAIIIIAAGVLFAFYAFLSTSGEVKEKRQKEGSIYELKQQIISQNVKIQKSEFERAGLATELEKARKELEALKSDFQETKTNETALKEDLQGMRLSQDGSKSNMDVLQAENESLKEKLMEKENETKRLSDQVKLLNEKLKTMALETQKKDIVEPKNVQPDNPANKITKDIAPSDKNIKSPDINPNKPL